MATIGYERAKNMMMQLDWKLAVSRNEDGGEEEFELYHPKQRNIYTVRKDSGRRLMAECRVCEGESGRGTILCYNHVGSNEKLI